MGTVLSERLPTITRAAGEFLAAAASKVVVKMRSIQSPGLAVGL